MQRTTGVFDMSQIWPPLFGILKSVSGTLKNYLKICPFMPKMQKWWENVTDLLVTF